MSNEEEKRCPLCAEEMDWTDQQLKPCQCGYQVCVWCWHHIMEMAEKDQTEGRCPACRAPYDKEKIVGMEANCESRVVTISTNRKNKLPKPKPKPNEVKEDLINVRVIQRKMAYVIGLPLSLADEDLLRQKEYFGQYGKVSKLSLSRTAGGAIQQFIYDTCSVYITYSKEEEAIRCIQSVHGFVLEGRFLRASFGTAKYCHAWLRNMPCNNSACLYLHSIGAEEDSFGKDEVAAVHTRSRVQQIVGATHNLQRRSGNVLPSPVEDPFSYIYASVEKSTVNSILKDATHATVDSGGQLTCLLSSKDQDRGARTPNKMTTFVDILRRSSSSGSEKDGNVAEDRRILDLCSDLSSVTIDKDNLVKAEHIESMLSEVSSSSHLISGLPRNKEYKEYSIEPFREPSNFLALGRADATPSEADNSRSMLSEVSPSSLLVNGLPRNQEYKEYSIEPFRDPSSFSALGRADLTLGDKFAKEPSCLTIDSGRQVLHNPCSVVREDLLPFANRRSKDSDSLNQTACLMSSYDPNTSEDSSGPAWQHKEPCSLSNLNADHNTVNNHVDKASIDFTCVNSILNDGYNETKFQSSASSDRIYKSSNSFSNEEIVEHLRRLDDYSTANDEENSALNAVENSIISNILSMDFDTCDDSLTMPHSLAGLFDETDRSHGSSWNFCNRDQSGFSFAKQEGFASQVTDLKSFSNIGQVSNKCSALQDSGKNKEQYMCKRYHVSRAQSLTPPGFSVQSRDPPPGFPACERTDQVLRGTSGSHLVKASSPTNHYQAPSSGNISNTGNVDFIDPAILVVGRGKQTNGLHNSGLDIRPDYTSQMSAFEDETRLWLLMQQSTSAHQDPKFSQFYMQQTPYGNQELRYSGRIGEGFSPLDDIYGISSRLMDQHQSYNPSSFTQLSQQKFANGNIANGYQPSLDEVQHRNEVGLAELQRNERLGFNKYSPGHGDLMFQMPSSGDVYTRVFGM